MTSSPIYISSCSQQTFVGVAPIGYFILGIIETFFFLNIAFLIVKNICFPTINSYGEQSILLPLYFSVTIVIVIIGLLIGIDYILGYEPTNFILLLIKWVVIRFFSEGLSIFFLYVGIGLRSIRNSFFVSLIWSIFNWMIIIITYLYGSATVFLAVIIFIFCSLILYYLNMWLLPLNYLHRRPAIFLYSLQNLMILLIQLISSIVYIYFSYSEEVVCDITIIFGVCEFLQLIIILKAFTEDSKFWLGLYVNSRTNLNEPLIGIWNMNVMVVDSMTNTINNLERQIVPMIPFSKLTVDTSKYFSGGSARVYKGKYLVHEVAIKFLFCLELTPERVVEFCEEATLLNSLEHSNIVTCYGVSVMPPAISLITEYCTFGSLFDFLHATDVIVDEDTNNNNTNKSSGNNSGTSGFSSDNNISDESGNEDSIIIGIKDTNEEENNNDNNNSPPRSSSIRFENSVNRLSSYGSRLSFVIEDDRNTTITDNENYDIAAKLVDAMKQANKTRSIKFRRNLQKDSGRLSLSGSLQSATSVLLSRDMGFGLGPANLDYLKIKRRANTLDVSNGKFSSSRHSFLLSFAGSSMRSIGNLLPIMIRLKMARDCSNGLAFLHHKRYMHCDIKSLNFLVTSDLTVKLADLGEARSLLSDAESDVRELPRNINWTSPEILSNQQGEVTESADVWSLAMVIAEIFSGEIPFDSTEHKQMSIEAFLNSLKDGNRPKIPQQLLNITWIEEMMQKAWNYDHRNRCTAIYIAEEIERNIIQFENK